MKKRPEKENKPLDFNFDEPAAPAKEADAGFETEFPRSENLRWGRRGTSRRAPVLTAEEVMGVRPSAPSAGEQPKRPTQPIPMRPANLEPEPDASAPQEELSFAARMILRRMQEAETNASEPDQPDQPAAPAAPFGRNIPEFESDDVEPAVPAAAPETIPMTPAAKAEPEPTPVSEEPAPTVDGATRVMETPVSAADVPADGATRVVDVKAPDVSPSSEEAAFAAARRAYVEQFTLDADLTDVPADGAARVVPTPPPVGEDEFDDVLPEDGKKVETIDEYRSVEDADAIYTEFSRRRSRLTVRSILSLALTVALGLMTFADHVIPFGNTVFFVVMWVLLTAGALCNVGLFSSIGSLFKRKGDVDVAPALALLAAMIQTGLCGWLGAEGLTAASMVATAAMLSVTFNDFGKLAIVKRILLNFETVGNEETKNAVALVGEPVSSRIADPERVGESLIAGRACAIDLKDFLSYSFSPDPYEGQTFRMAILSLAGGLVSVLLTLLLLKGSVPQAATAFATVMAVCAPLTAFLATGRHFLHTCARLRDEGAMLSGYRAAEDVTEANVVAINADELFSDDCVVLYNFKTFYEFPFDDAIIMAAALTKEGHSPLSWLFNQIVAENAGKLPAVDTVIYEDHMGLTGWVNDRKTLIGNRMILESHNIPAPPLSLDKKIVAGGGFPVYLAVEERLVAIFVVGYKPDGDLLHRVRRLVNTGVTLLVDTADPNVTDQLVADSYGIPRDAVMVLSADAARRCREQFAPREQEAARMTAANARGYIDGYLAAYRLRRSAAASSVGTVVATCLGVALTVALPVLGLGHLVSVITLLGFQALTYLVFSVLHRFSRL